MITSNLTHLSTTLLPVNMSQSKTWESTTMSDLLVAFITTTSILSDVSAEQKEEVVAFMQKRGYDAMSWDKIRYVSCL